MKAAVKGPGITRLTHVIQRGKTVIATTFGTFHNVDGKWKWLSDDRFELVIEKEVKP